jgi:uncharacterized membrane protein YccC
MQPSVIRDRLWRRLVTEGPQTIRIVITACVAWQICIWLGARHPPVYAVIVPLVAMRDDPFSAFNVSFDRLLGVVAGLSLGLLVVQWLGPNALSIAIVLAVGLLGGMLLRVGASLNVQVAVSALLAFANSNPDAYAFSRLWETAIGAAATVVLAPLLLPPNARATITAAVVDIGRDLAAALERGCALITAPQIRVQQLDLLRDECRPIEDRARALTGQFTQAVHSVAINPLRRGDRQPLAALADTVAVTIELTRGTRQFADELAALSPREDLQPEWPSIAAPLTAMVTPLVQAIRAAIKPPADVNVAEYVAALAAGSQALAEWRSSDHRPISVVVRRPLHTMFDELNRFPLPAASASPAPSSR